MGLDTDRILDLKEDIDAILHAAGRPLAKTDLARCLEISMEDVEEVLLDIESDLMERGRGVLLQKKRGNVRFVVKAPRVPIIGKVFPERAWKPLTYQAKETLAVISLKPGLSTAEIALNRRLADSSGTVESLAQRGLIGYKRVKGIRKWWVTQAFLDHYNLSDVKELRDEAVFREVFPELAD